MTIPETLELNPPADRDLIEKAEAELGLELPTEYVEFLKMSDGAEGPIGTAGYIQLWRVEELKSLNDAYAVDEFAPGLLLFGSNGGGTAYAFESGGSIIDIPFMGFDRSEARRLGDTFSEFLMTLSKE